MTTPRVTVPVEPEYTATEYLRLIAEGWEVIESTGSQMTIQNPEDDGPQELVIDVDLLSAAPAPEGGAGLELIEAAKECVRLGRSTGEDTPENRKRARAQYRLNQLTTPKNIIAALATREEAPAEAGEEDVRGLIGEAIQGLERAITSTRFDSASKEVFAACVDDFRKVLRSQPPAREDAQPVALTVWYGEMPESNGRRNWTATLRRVNPTDKWDQGFCFARSEYPDRVRYEADRMRWIIGELTEKPDILAYDADAHSGYVAPHPAPDALREEVERLRAALNTPEVDDFAKAVVLEAQHQRERWPSEHDAGKAPLDWFWLVGYLAQKAATAQIAGDDYKAKHHTISTAAALANWHAAISGEHTEMRPGIEPPATEAAALQAEQKGGA